MQQLNGVAGGTLNVAVISAGDYFFPRLLAEFSRRNPGTILNLTVHNRAELLHQLADNLTDLAIMVRPPMDMDTVNESFAPHPCVVVAAPGHPLAKKKRIPMAVLARERFVAREKDSGTWHSMKQAFGRWFGKLDVVMEIKSTETIKQSVIAGLGVAFLSAVANAFKSFLVTEDAALIEYITHFSVQHGTRRDSTPILRKRKRAA